MEQILIKLTPAAAVKAYDLLSTSVDNEENLTVVVDRMSVPYLQDATVDFVDTIEKQGFTIDNPNATGSCACGDSFH